MILYRNFLEVISQYAVFEGRASRSEFWWYILALLIVALLVSVASLPLLLIPYAVNIVTYAFVLAVLTPTLAVTDRRLHDTERSAWWALCYVPSGIYDLLVLSNAHLSNAIAQPVAGIGIFLLIVLIIFMALPGTGGDNKYGADPRQWQ